MMLLAESATFMGVEVTTLVGVGTALVVLFGIWKNANAAKREIIGELKSQMRADQALAQEENHRTVGPQPFEVAMQDEPVKRTSYEVHCRINREEHARIERDLTKAVEGIKTLHHGLAREVSAMNARSETNEGRLILMDAKLDSLRTQISQK